jgi:hypothetical protein
VAERASLENWRWGNPSASSNLAPSAIVLFRWSLSHGGRILHPARMKPLQRDVFVRPQAEAYDGPQELLAMVLAAKPAE